jgi:putative transposase
MTRARVSPELTEVSPQDWQEARRRLEIIQPLAAAADRTRSSVHLAAKQLKLSVTHAYRLLKRYDADPRLTSLLPARRGRKPGHCRLATMVEEVIQTAIDEVYLTRQKPRVTVLVAEVHRRCRVLGLRTPSAKAVRRRLQGRPASELLARREGRKAARDRFGPVTGSPDAPWPLSLVQIDHTLVDVIVVDSITREPIQRPWLTLAIDVHSRCVPGFYLSLEPPSATSVALCIAHSALPKEAWLASLGIEVSWPIGGIPERFHLDNAREFHSEALRRGCQQYGIGIDYRPVATPHYGGHIERLIGTMMGKVHLLPGTTFSDTRIKGDLDPEKTAAMTLEELQRWLVHAIAGEYHNTVHSAVHMPPVAAWQRGILGDERTPGRGEPTAVVDRRRFLIDFLPLQRRLVRREGISLHSVHYWSDALSVWIGRAQKMIVRYDPRDLSRIYLLAPDGQYYDLSYRDLRRPPISLWEHRLALERLRAQGRAHIDEAAIFRAVENMRTIAQDASRQSKVARRQRERRLPLIRGGQPDRASAHSAAAQTHSMLDEHEQDTRQPWERMLPVEEWS